MKYIYKINGTVWKEESNTEYRATEKAEKPSSSVAFYALLFLIYGIPGGLGAYFAPEAWGGVAIGGLGTVLASTLDGEDAEVRLFLTIFCVSAALISLMRLFASISS